MTFLRNTRKGRKAIVSRAPFNIFLLFFMALGIWIIPVQEAHAGVSYQAISSIAASTGADVTVTLPAHQANDIFLITVVVRDQDDTITWPSGWTAIATVDRSTVSRYWWAWARAASSSETNPLVDKSTATGDTYAMVITFRGAITTGDPWEVKGTASTGTTDPAVLTGITTLTEGSLVVAALGGEDDNNGSVSWTATHPETLTDHWAVSGTGSDGMVAFGEGAKGWAGATGNASGDFSVANPVGWGGIVLALKPVAATSVYYSVGQNTTDHSSGGNVSISSGVATFTTAQTQTNLGVGDRLTAGGNAYYLASKISTTQWNVVTKLGAVPADLSSTGVTSIAHEYTSLNGALTGASDSNHLNATNLTTGNYILNIPCYYDSGADTTQVTIGTGWTTGSSNYINIYTPTNTSTECNQTQRHSGKWDATKYNLSVSTAGVDAMDIFEEYVRIDGLQIYRNGLWDCVWVQTTLNAATDIRVSNSILRGNITSNQYGINADSAFSGTITIWNTIAYNNKTGGFHIGNGVECTGKMYCYNCTAIDNGKGFYISTAGDPTMVLTNCLGAYNTTDFGCEAGGCKMTATYSASKDATADDWGGSGNRVSQTTFSFKDYSGDDFRLKSDDTAFMDYGTSDPGSGLFSTDIEGESRPFGNAWDIGADEYTSVTAVFLKSFSATEYEGKVLLQWKTGYEANNLGFHVYRDEDGQLSRVNPELITGGALLVGAGRATAGHTYAWLDTLDPTATLKDRPPEADSRSGPPGLKGRGAAFGLEDRGAAQRALRQSSSAALLESGQRRDAPQAQRSVVYWLEDVDLSGKRTMNGPVIPEVSLDPLPERGQAALLSQLSRGQSDKDKVASRLWALQARLGKTQTSDIRRQTSDIRGQTSDIRRQTSDLGRQTSDLRPSVLGPRSAEIVVPGVDTGNRTGTLPSGSPGRSDRPGTPITLPSGVNKNLPPQEVQWMLASWPAVKLFIQEEGWYRVTQPELVAAGLDPRVNPRNLQVYADGQEQAIEVNVRQEGQFGSQDAIGFYGTGLDTPFTDTRVYWLVVGAKPGKRVAQVGSLTGQAGSASFPFTVEQKPRTGYIAAVKNGDESNFFGPLVWTTPVEQVLNVAHPDPAALGSATLEVALQGGTEGTHQVKVLLNGVEVGSLVFEGQSPGVTTLSVSQSLLVEGDNQVSLVAQGGDMDVSLIDYIRLTSWHTYTADSDALRFTAVGGQQVLMDGFSSSLVRVVDITDPKRVQEVVGEVRPQGTGYGVQFAVPGTGPRTLLAFAGGQVKSVAAVEAKLPSRWYQAGWGADLVIISHASFIDSVKPLKALREAQGWTVALVDVEDVYDEFGFGNKTPQALKDFLLRARVNWQKAPSFVLLVGDASMDPRNYLGMGSFDFVPTKLMDTAYLETASDDWFADFHGEGLAEMAVGRLPVRTVEEASIMVSKIVGYEQSAGGMAEVMLVADMGGNGSFDFEGASSEVAALLGGNVTVRKVFRSQFTDDTQVHAELLRGLNGGKLLLNYMGHGSEESWRGDIFTLADAGALTNGLRLPFVVSMTCLNGFFHDIYSDSLAEGLLKAKQGGAVAVWASSGLTEPDKQAVLNKELIRLLFNGESLTLGEAVKRAKTAVSDPDVRRTWIFFGDPTTRLR